MKLRIRGNSIRVRVDRKDLAELLDRGRVLDVLRFGPGSTHTFTYAVMKQADGTGHIIVNPDHVEVLNEIPGKNTLTLTACHPKYSASERIIVFAQLRGEPKPTPPPPAGTGTGTEKASAPTLNTESLSGKKAAKLPTILFALLCAAIWTVAWQLGKRWKKWPSYAIGLPFFLIALFYFFENFSRLLPSNF